MKESSSDLVAMNEEPSNPVSSETGIEVSSTECRCYMLHPNFNVENSSNSSTCETLTTIKSPERQCSISTDDDVEDMGANSMNPVASITKESESIASTALGNGNPSVLVTLESLNETMSAERCSARKDGDWEATGESSSNLEASATAVEVGCTEAECFASKNRVSEAKTDLEGSKMLVDKMKLNVPSGPHVVIDVKGGDDGGLDNGEEVCRICHLSSDHQSGVGRFIQLGCGCKDGLGTVHRHCAEVWFRLKGNRRCEICGQATRNIRGVGDDIFMEWWSETRTMVTTGGSRSPQRCRCGRVQLVCNLVMVCLVLSFVLPWYLGKHNF